MLTKIRNKILQKNPDNIRKKSSTRIDFDNRYPDDPKLDGKRLGAGNISDMEAYLDNVVANVLKEHTSNVWEKYLTEIRPYITYEDEPLLTCESVKRHLDDFIPKVSEKDFQLEI